MEDWLIQRFGNIMTIRLLIGITIIPHWSQNQSTLASQKAIIFGFFFPLSIPITSTHKQKLHAQTNNHL